MNWLLLVGISAITSSFARVLQKVLLKDKESDPAAFGFIFGIAVGLMMSIWALIEGFKIPNLSPIIFNLVLMSLFYSLGNWLLFKSFKIAEASEVMVLFSSGTLWAVISAVILLGERFTPVKWLATALVVLGVVFISYRKSQWKPNKGHLFVLLASLCFGLAFTNDAFILKSFSNVSSYMVFVFFIPSFVLLLFSPKSIASLTHFMDKGIIPKLALTSLIYGISTFAIYQAYKNGGPASVISPISQASVLVTVFIGYVFLKERDRLLNKVAGAVLMFLGIWLLS